MTRYVAGYLYWGVGWLLVGFLAAELLGLYGVAPWPTFSETVWHAEHYEYVKPLVFSTLLTLMLHFLYHRPLVMSVVFALAVAAVAHVVDARLP